MFLNRTPIIPLQEADEKLRNIERQAKTGDPEARAAWFRELRRTGRGAEADHHEFTVAYQQLAREADRAHKAFTGAWRRPRPRHWAKDADKLGADRESKLSAASAVARKARNNLRDLIEKAHNHDRENAGKLLKRYEGQRVDKHIHDLAAAAHPSMFDNQERNNPPQDQEEEGDNPIGRAHFKPHHDLAAEHFKSALKHHYPDSGTYHGRYDLDGHRRENRNYVEYNYKGPAD